MANVVKVVNNGIGIINNRLKNGDTGATEPKYAHWGTGATAANVANTALQTPATEARVDSTTTREMTTVANDTYQAIALLTCNATAKAITEVGLFDASTGGNLFLRATFDVLNVANGDSIQFTIKTVSSQV